MKTIAIRDEVHKKLLTIKGKHGSFSELLERLVEEANPLKTLANLGGSVEFRDKGGGLGN